MRKYSVRAVCSWIKRSIICFLYVILMLICKVVIRLLSFKKIITLFGSKQPETPIAYTLKNLGRASLMQYCLALVLYYLPKPFVCYEQALSSMLIARLLKIPLIMHYGVQRGEDSLKAHAWTICDQVIISGESDLQTYKSIYQFAYIPRKSYDR